MSLFAASGLAAVMASDWATARAKAIWQAEHAPSLALWRHLVASHGYHPVSDERQSGPVLRSLPLSEGISASVWLDPNFHAIVLDLKGAGAPVYLRGKLARGERPHWIRFEIDWDSFEKLDAALKKAPIEPRKARTQRVFSDPRAITY